MNLLSLFSSLNVVLLVSLCDGSMYGGDQGDFESNTMGNTLGTSNYPYNNNNNPSQQSSQPSSHGMHPRFKRKKPLRVVYVPYDAMYKSMLKGFNPPGMPQLMPIREQMRCLANYLAKKKSQRGGALGMNSNDPMNNQMQGQQYPGGMNQMQGQQYPGGMNQMQGQGQQYPGGMNQMPGQGQQSSGMNQMNNRMNNNRMNSDNLY